MYLLYLDDSGSVPNKNEQYFVLAGICVFERRIHWITERLNKLAEIIYPNDPNGIEFHASEIYAGRSAPWESISRNNRIDIIKDVLKSIEDEHETSVVFACAVHKKSFQRQDPVLIAFEDLCSRFDMLLQRKYKLENESHRGLIIFDKSAYETSLQSLAIKFRQLGTRWRIIRNINEVPLFVDSKASRLIQLADHIAYAVFGRYEAGDLNYFNCIEGRFDSEEGKIHGLVHKQNNNPNCTCPACISRMM
jgi:hypothetical protein